MLHAATEADLTAQNKVFSIALDTALPLMQLQYIGDLTYGNYSFADTNDLTLFADDTDGATTTVLTIATDAGGYDTMGEVVDGVNATGVFRAFLIGGDRADTSTAMFADVANETCKLANGVTLFSNPDTDTAILGFAFTNQKFIYRPTGGWATFEKGWTKDVNCINSLKMLSATLTIAAHANVRLYSCDDENKTTGVLLWSQDLASTVEELHGDTNPNDIFVSGIRGHRLCIKFVALTAADNLTGFVIRSLGQTKDVAGGQVPSSNYTGCV